jgi:hypothetical protein
MSQSRCAESDGRIIHVPATLIATAVFGIAIDTVKQRFFGLQ